MNLNIFKESTQRSILNETKEIADYTRVIAGMKPQTWNGIKAAVNRGIAKSVLPVGTQIEDAWKTYTAVWDVVHHAADGSMFLNWHYADPNEMPFDAPEAVFYADANGLAAGTHHIPIGTTYGTGWSTGKSIQFTLTRAMV